VAALRELSNRLRRGGVDPLSDEYRRMTTLVSQLELSALRAERAAHPEQRSDRADDSRRYSDDAAEYYRRLGTP
jgi:hypothetical protein